MGVNGVIRFSGVGYNTSGCRVTLNGSTVAPRSLPQAARLLEASASFCFCFLCRDRRRHLFFFFSSHHTIKSMFLLLILIKSN